MSRIVRFPRVLPSWDDATGWQDVWNVVDVVVTSEGGLWEFPPLVVDARQMLASEPM